MKKIYSVLILVALTTTVTLESEEGASSGPKSLNVEIQGIDTSRKGSLIVMLFRRPGFPTQHQSALQRQTIPVKDGYARVMLRAPAEGEYAVKVLHDEDGDGQVTKKLIGIPGEGLGFSNGARLNFGPPTWSDARFSTTSVGNALKIRMQYL